MPRNKHEGYELDQSPFYCLKSQKKLARLLRVGKNKLKVLTQSEDLYSKGFARGQHNKKRPVEKPRLDLKIVQRRIDELLKRIKLPSYVYAPGKGSSYIDNAQAHVNTLVVRKLDIEKYYPSTPSRRIFWFFHKRMKCSSDVAGILTKLSTFNDHLPTGSPSSPILSYFSHIDMWERISEIAKSGNCNLTIYMDDVTISGEQVPDRLIWQIKQQFHRCGLRSNRKKEKYYAGGKPRTVTGVIITSKGSLALPNCQHLKMYKIRRLINKTKSEDQYYLRQVLNGLEAQAQQVEKANSSFQNIT